MTFSLLYSSWSSAPVGWNVIITMILNLIFVSLYQATKKEAIDNNFGGYEVQYTAYIYTDSFLGVGYDYKIKRYKDGAHLH